MKRIIAVLLALFVLGGALAAQNKAALQVQCNQSGAQVFVNGRMMGTTSPNIALLLPAGTYQVKVVKSGYNDFDASVTLTSAGAVLQANLVAKGAAAAPAPAPTPAPRANVLQFGLTVTSNVNGASVSINGQAAGKTPFTAQMPMGSYALVVSAPGYVDFSQNVTLNTTAVQVNATLNPSNVQIDVTANVSGADVYINGNLVGKTPFAALVPPGAYNVMVKAPNYIDYNQTVTVNAATRVNATLNPQNYQLDVDSSVRGAEVTVNGTAYGKTPFAALLPPGNYVVGVRAPGYQDFSAPVSMNGPQKVFATLQQLMATWQIAVPAAEANADLRGAHWAQMQIFVDGSLVKAAGSTAPTSGQFVPGSHLIRIASGGLAAETRIEATAGRTYSIETIFDLTVK